MDSNRNKKSWHNKYHLNNNGIVTKGREVEITISTVKDVIIDGNTYYYITDKDNKKYRASIKVNSNKLPFIKPGDKVIVAYSEKEVREIINIK